jgi:hypothetical protein
MYLLDRDLGARRRGLIRDRAVRAGLLVGGAAGSTAHDLGNRARGVAAAARARVSDEQVDDRVVAERVRAELGRVVSHPGAITVTADSGRVTLGGQVLGYEFERLMDRVRKVRGVRGVRSELEVHDSADDVPALQGGESPGNAFPRHRQRWSPTTRLLTTVAGSALALYGSRRRDPLGAALGLGGLALATRGATDTRLGQLAGRGARLLASPVRVAEHEADAAS